MSSPLHRVGRILLGIVTVLLGLVAVAVLAVAVLSGTDWGRERVRGFAVSRLANMVHGQVTIGKVSGNLLEGFTIENVAIRDSAGQPFLAAQEVSAKYQLSTLLHRKIYLDHVRLVRPLLVLDKEPGREWNYATIFASDTTPSQPNGAPTYLRFEDVTVVDGEVLVRSPWSPSKSLSGAAKDSAVREALGGRTRLMVIPARNPAPSFAPYQKVVELRGLDARLPLVQLSDPNEKNRIIRVASLRTSALPFRPPAAVVSDLRGTFRLDGDSLWWGKDVAAVMPGSRIGGSGAYVFSDGDMRLDLHGAPAALADLRWLYPRLPAEGAGTLDFRMVWQGSTQDYLATNADIHSGNTHITGDFGLTLTDSLAFHDTNLQFANLDTRLIEQLAPGISVPRRGSLDGRLALAGGVHAMHVDGDVAFADARAGTSRAIAVGDVGMIEGGGVRATNLRVNLHPLQVELAKGLASGMADLPVSGLVTGRATINGTTNSQLVANADLTHTDRGAVSRLTGRTALRLRGGTWLDANLVAHPVDLAEVGRFAPALGLHGTLVGPVRARGTLRDLAIDADVRLPDNGQLVARGRLDLASPVKGYDLALGMKVVNLETVIARAPATSLTLTATGKGRGFSPGTMQAAFAADFATSSWDSLALDSGTVRVAVANGLARVDRLLVGGEHARIDAAGSFGLVASRQGRLSYHLTIDSLGAFDRLVPHSTPDTGAVAPRPAVVARAVRRARDDSVRIAQATEVERMATGRALPRLQVDTPAAVPNDLRGEVYAAGVLSGNLQRFDLNGRLFGRHLVIHGSSADSVASMYAWRNARTPESTIALGLSGTSISAMGFGFDSADARFSYHAPGGRAELVVKQGDAREYGLRTDYVFDADERLLNLRDLVLRFDSTTWQATHPAVVQWRPRGVEVKDFDIRNGRGGHIYANGLLPTQGEARFQLDVDRFQVADIFALLQTDLEVVGLASFHGTVSGTSAAPAIRGTFAFDSGSYNTAPVPDLKGNVAYTDRSLVAHLDALRGTGAPLTTADVRLPVNLAFTGVTGSRLLDGPLSADVVADSLPIELVSQFTDAVSDVHGLAAGRFAVRGTVRSPKVTGGLLLARGTIKLTSTGMFVDNLAGSVRMSGDTIHIDSLAGRARGEVRVNGTIAMTDLRDPTFNVYLVSQGAEVLNNERGRLRADAGLRFTGPLSKAYLSGQVTVTQGVVFAPDPTGRHVIGTNDPDLFNVADTAMLADRELFPVQSPLLQNMRVEVALAVNRSTWVRNKDANIEIFTDYPLDVRVFRSAIALTGSIGTDRGEYNFLSKRFQITHGSATFVGTPDLNPTLQVTGDFQVNPPNSQVLNIQVVIGGTLNRPKLSLESDAQPPRSQSDLLSLLAFGETSNSLLGGTSSNSIASVGTSGSPVGAGAKLAANRLTGIAVGVLVDEVESDAGRALGADQFNITPGDVPEVSNLAGPSSLGTFLNSTRIEAGKYLNPRTFVALQQYSGDFGSRIEYRTGTGWRYSAFLQPYLLLKTPSLATQPVRTIRASYGAFIFREWRF